MKVLLVCLGNICRSPTAEGIFRDLAARHAPELALHFDSAGTADYHVGRPPDRRSQRAAHKRGVDIGGLRARQVEREDFDRFDWILAMDRSNLADLHALQPQAGRARIELLLSVLEQRGPDVPDPYNGSERDFDDVYDLIASAAALWLESWRTAAADTAPAL